MLTVNGELILENLKLINSKAEDDCGVIYAYNAKLTLINTTLQNNQATGPMAVVEQSTVIRVQ